MSSRVVHASPGVLSCSSPMAISHRRRKSIDDRTHTVVDGAGHGVRECTRHKPDGCLLYASSENAFELMERSSTTDVMAVQQQNIIVGSYSGMLRHRRITKSERNMNIIPSGLSAGAISVRRGFSLIELAMVLAIISLMASAAMLLFETAHDHQIANDAVEEIETIVSVSHTLYESSPDYTGLTGAVLAHSGMFPSRYVTAAQDNLVTPWNTATWIRAQPKETNNNDVIQIWFYGTPRDTCLKIATAEWGPAGLSRNINGADSNDASMTPQTADAACHAGMTNTIGLNMR